MIQPTLIVRQILADERTQIRRLLDTSQPRYIRNRSKRGQSQGLRVPFNPNAGDHLTISATRHDDDPLRARIILEDARVDLLGSLTLADARAMGHRTRDEFKDAWVRQHDRAWVDETERAGDIDGGDWLTARFNQRWANKRCWVLEFHRDRAQGARWLGDRNARADYVDSPHRALKDEPCAVEPEEQALITLRAGMVTGQWQAIEHARRDAELEQLSLGGRLDRLVREADLAGIATSKEIRVIEKRLQAIHRQLNQRAA